MKRTVKALQDLYVKLGGSLTDTYNGIANGIKVGLYKRIPDIIEAVKEKASGGAGLPEVTAADNGDVLTVVEGAWAKADAPSGGDVLNVGFSVSFTDPSNPVYSCDTSFADIAAAYASGTQVIATMDGWQASYYVFSADELGGAFSVSFVQFSGGYMYVYNVNFGDDEGTESVTGSYTAYTLTPAS